jgi:hypothetical protein
MNPLPDLETLVQDADTLDPIANVQMTLMGFGFSDRVQATDANGITVFSAVAWPGTLEYVTLYALKSGYLNQKLTLYYGTLSVTLKLKKEYYPPPPPPPPPPPGETVVERVGLNCSLNSKYLFGSQFYYLRHDTQGALTTYDSDINDIRAKYSKFAQCYSTPPPPPLPPSDVALGALITNTSAATQALIDTTSGMQTSGLNQIAANLTGVFNYISNTVVGALNDISGSLGSVLGAINAIAASQAASRQENQKGFGDLLAWTKDVKFPDPSKFIVDSVNGLLQPARDVLAWTQNFKFPDWNAAIVQPVADSVDAWFSGLLGIDPKKPFWDEIATKIIGIVTMSIDAILNAIVPPPPPPYAPRNGRVS